MSLADQIAALNERPCSLCSILADLDDTDRAALERLLEEVRDRPSHTRDGHQVGILTVTRVLRENGFSTSDETIRRHLKECS